MRIPLIVSLLILIVAAGVGWRDHQRLVAARAAHADLVARAEVRGMRLDPSGSGRWTQIPKRPRVDRKEEARRVAAEFLAYAEEMSALGDELRTPDEATRQKIIAQMDQVKSLDGSQLRVLTEEICLAENLENNQRLQLFRFAIGRLTEDHPRESLELLLTFPGALEIARSTNGCAENLIMDAFRSLSVRDPEMAIDWFRRRRGEIPEALIKNAKWGLVKGSSSSNPGLAFRFVSELGLDPEGTAPGIARAAETSAERLNVLGALRQWDGLSERATAGEVIQLLAMGESYEPRGFDEAVAWINKAKLDEVEIEVMVAGIERSVKLEESGRWIQWLGDALPEGRADESIKALMMQWVRRDYRAAEAWLEQLDEGLVKEVATQAYQETVAP